MNSIRNTFLDWFNSLLIPETDFIGIDPFSSNDKRGVIGYYHSHFPRFELGEKIIRRHIPLLGARILEFSPYPFYSLYFKEEVKEIICSDIMPRTWEDKNMKALTSNLCYDTILTLGSFDLVICPEVLEHLPCNIPGVIRRLKDLTENWLYISVPIGSVNVAPKEEDLGHFESPRGHLREFRDGELDQYFNDLVLLHKESVSTPAYHRMDQYLFCKGHHKLLLNNPKANLGDLPRNLPRKELK
jgi:hypothetical protein